MGVFLGRNSLSICVLVLLVAISCINCKPASTNAGKDSSKSGKSKNADDATISIEDSSEQAEKKSSITEDLNGDQGKKSNNSDKKQMKSSAFSEQIENGSSEKKRSKGLSEVSENLEKTGKSSKRSDFGEVSLDKKSNKKVAAGEEMTSSSEDGKEDKKNKGSQKSKDVSNEEGYGDNATARGGWDFATIISEHDDHQDETAESAGKNNVSDKKSKKQSADEDSEPLPRPAGQKRLPETTITPRGPDSSPAPPTNGGFSSGVSRVVYAMVFTVLTAALLL